MGFVVGTPGAAIVEHNLPGISDGEFPNVESPTCRENQMTLYDSQYVRRDARLK